MIRVGFIIDFSDKSWQGGVNYYLNLFDAIYALKDRKIEPVVLYGLNTDVNQFRDFPAAVEKIRIDLKEISTLERFIGERISVILKYNWVFQAFLKRHKISILSHFSHSGDMVSPKIPAIGWIPDFQHLHLPEFFSKEEIAFREMNFRQMCRSCSCVILSSYSAQNDLACFAPDCLSKSRVLQFVAGGVSNGDTGLEQLEERYGFKGPYFYVPNQFWIHKNHRVIIDALSVLKSAGRDVLAISTGNAEDYRQPDYFKTLLEHARKNGIADNFRVLGMVPRRDVAALMYYSLAVINPSFFEGWSTTVEEAKSMGKRVILSDIPVHREQDPAGGVFFDPKNPHDLAEAMWKLWSTGDSENEKELMRKAQADLPFRRERFAKNYQDLVLSIL